MPKAITKVYLNSFEWKPSIAFSHEPQQNTLWKKQVSYLHNRLKKIITTKANQTKNKRIAEAIKRLRKSRFQNTKYFFKKANSEKAKPNQQMIIAQKTLQDGSTEDTNDPEEVKQTIADYWQSIWTGSETQTNDPKPWWTEVNRNPLKAQIKTLSNNITAPLATKEVKKALKYMAKNKASGPNNIPVEILKVMATDQTLLVRITQLLQVVIDTKAMPEQWRHSNIWTIYKSGSVKLPQNY